MQTKKKKKQTNKHIEEAHVQLAHRHFCPSHIRFFPTKFSLYFGEKTFLLAQVGPTIIFPSPFLNKTPSKIFFLPIFFPKFSIHPISPPNKH